MEISCNIGGTHVALRHRLPSYFTYNKFIGLCLSGSFLIIGQSAFAQTTTTYTYDSKGRVTTASTSNNTSETYSYDDANNIKNVTITTNSGSGGNGGGGNGGSNSPPVCQEVFQGATGMPFVGDGLQNCTDPDGDILTLISVTDPPGAPTAVKSGNSIIFNGIPGGTAAATVRTVSDGSVTVTSTYNVINFEQGGCDPFDPFDPNCF